MGVYEDSLYAKCFWRPNSASSRPLKGDRFAKDGRRKMSHEAVSVFGSCSFDSYTLLSRPSKDEFLYERRCGSHT